VCRECRECSCGAYPGAYLETGRGDVFSPRDSKIEKWRQWLDEKIRPEVIGMYHHRRVYRTMGKIVERHGSLPPSNIFDFCATRT
jgi:hypothetical protein